MNFRGKSMKQKFSVSRWQVATVLGALASVIAAPAMAGPKPFDHAKKENWGVSVRNTIGSPVAELRNGMSSRLTPVAS